MSSWGRQNIELADDPFPMVEAPSEAPRGYHINSLLLYDVPACWSRLQWVSAIADSIETCFEGLTTEGWAVSGEGEGWGVGKGWNIEYRVLRVALQSNALLHFYLEVVSSSSLNIITIVLNTCAVVIEECNERRKTLGIWGRHKPTNKPIKHAPWACCSAAPIYSICFKETYNSLDYNLIAVSREKYRVLCIVLHISKYIGRKEGRGGQCAPYVISCRVSHGYRVCSLVICLD